MTHIHPKLAAHFERLNELRLAEMAALDAANDAEWRYAAAFHARPWRPITDRKLQELEIAAMRAADAAAAATAAYLEERAKLPALREVAEKEDRELEASREEMARAREAFENQPDPSRAWYDTSAELK